MYVAIGRHVAGALTAWLVFTAEALVEAAPDVLVVTTTGLASVGGIDGLLTIPGIARTPAGRAGRVIAREDQYLLGGGPRTGQLLLDLLAELHS